MVKLSILFQIAKGKLYSPSTTEVTVIPQGNGATATAQIRRWVKNRYKKLESSLDTANGYILMICLLQMVSDMVLSQTH
jgi:hypothetical protein